MKKNTLSIIIGFVILTAATAATIFVGPGKIWGKRKPQFAVWAEDADGKFVKTLFVTKSASSKGWTFGPDEGRPESLPVWYAAKGQDPAKKLKKNELDVSTGATPKKGTVININAELEQGKTYVIKAEFNQSFDYNETWTKENSGVNGQPSVVYTGTITPDGTEQEVVLAFAGTGSVDGSDGMIHTEFSDKLTTAKNIVDRIYFSIK